MPPPGGAARSSPQKVALISITTRCNANCGFCCVRDTLNRPELDPSDAFIERNMVEARESGCTVLSFTGGEPTAHPRFIELCRRARELGYGAVTINTNGIKFKSRDFCERAVEAGLSHVDFSIHGHTPEVHDALVERPGAFAALSLGLSHLLELSRTRPVILGATTVMTRHNASDLPALSRFLVAAGLRTIRFKHAFEGAPGADPDLVGEYSHFVSPLAEAVDNATSHGASVELTHVPLCLLGERLVLATDLGEERVLSIGRDGARLSNGRASLHRRKRALACNTCLLRQRCCGLDEKYLNTFGDAEIEPFLDEVSLSQRLRSGARRYGIGGARLAVVREQLERLGSTAPLVDADSPARDRRVESVSGPCRRPCRTLCDCRARRTALGVPKGPGDAVTLRGDLGLGPETARWVRAAHDEAWAEVWVRTSDGSDLELSAVQAAGLTGVVVPLFSHHAKVHDRIAGFVGALARSLEFVHRAGERGLASTIEVPLISRRLQSPGALIALAARAASGRLTRVRLYVSPQVGPGPLSPPSFAELRDALENASGVSAALGITLETEPRDGIPLCAIPKTQPVSPLANGREGSGHLEPCRRCNARALCPGPSPAYARAHGGRDLIPLEDAIR